MGRPRGSRNKKTPQNFHFPSENQPYTDAELDAIIDSEVEPSIEKTREENKKKKTAADVIKEIPQIFTAEQVAWIFDVYVILMCFVFSVLLKCEFKTLHEELKLEEDQKIAFAKPLAKVLSKYAPAKWAGMTAEIELCGCVGMWTATAFGRAKLAAEKEKQEKQKQSAEQKKRNEVTAMNRAATQI